MGGIDDDKRKTDWERWRLLCQVERAMEAPMAVLGLVWAVLVVVELVRGLSPFLGVLTNVIWAVFILDFLLRLVLAPRKLRYLARHALTALSLLLPALRMFRIIRLLRVVRGARLVKVLASMNRGMRSVRRASGRYGLVYVLGLTLLVISAGAAGMFAFERPLAGFETYGETLWWTAMLVSQVGIEHWPRSPEGRLLTVVLSIYGLALFGYITATFASALFERGQAKRHDGPK